MRSTKVATRYAKSLLDLALEQNLLEEAYADMVLIDKTCQDSRDLELLLSSPIVRTDKKEAIINALFGQKVNKLTNGFLSIILNRKREYLIPGIAAAFITRYKTHKKILVAEVTSAVALNDDLRKQVMDIVSKLEHDQLELVEKINPDLIGGLVLTVGDQQVDASLAKKINELKKEFSKNPYLADF